MEEYLPFGLVAFAVLYASGVIARRRLRARRRRKLREAMRTPITTIADAPEGKPIRIVGAVVATGELLTAPISGRRCVAFHALVEAHTGEAREPWAVVAEERQSMDFVVSDGTGRAVVDVATTELELEANPRTGEANATTPTVYELLNRHRADRRARPFAKRFRYQEHAFEVGARLAVMGVAVREPDPDAPADVTGYRDDPRTRLHLGGTPRQPCLVTDDEAALR